MTFLDIDNFTIKPVRIIPFDIGNSLNQRDLQNISNYLSLNYSEINRSERTKTLCKNSISYNINEFLDLTIFNTGIGVFTITEKSYTENNLKYFSIDYCQSRKKAHTNILNWQHHQSSTIKEIIHNLRLILSKSHKTLRITANDSFEQNGISYVMTITFLHFMNKKKYNFHWNFYPTWLKRNLIALLNPSILLLEDSLSFGQNTNTADQNLQRKVIDNLEIDVDYYDCEKRLHISTYASWAAVIVLGNLEKSDIEEYKAIEINLQQNWFYLYCMEKIMSVKSNEAKAI